MKYKITYYVNNVPVEKTVEAANQAELRAEIEKLPPGSVLSYWISHTAEAAGG